MDQRQNRPLARNDSKRTRERPRPRRRRSLSPRLSPCTTLPSLRSTSNGERPRTPLLQLTPASNAGSWVTKRSFATDVFPRRLSITLTLTPFPLASSAHPWLRRARAHLHSPLSFLHSKDRVFFETPFPASFRKLMNFSLDAAPHVPPFGAPPPQVCESISSWRYTVFSYTTQVLSNATQGMLHCQ